MKSKVNIKFLLQSTGEHETVSFIDLLRDLMLERTTGEDRTQNDWLQFSASAFISGYGTPALSDQRSQSPVWIGNNSIQFSQRGGAAQEFY